MKAMVLTKQGAPLTLQEIAEPVPAPDEVLVELEACGVCHTDLHIRDGDEALSDGTLPLVLGHEGIGRVVALGSGVTTLGVGDRVGVPWLHDTCLACPDCLTGHESICVDQRAHGMHVDGAFAERVITKAQFTVPIPEDMDAYTAAPLLCAGVTAHGAIRKAKLAPGDTCAIIGCGGLGQYGVQLARLTGARVIAIDTDPGRLEVAKQLGASETILSNADAGAALRELGGADGIVNFAPTPAIWPIVEAGLNNRGRFVSVAMPHDPVPLSLAWLTWITPIITGSSVGGRQDLTDLIALARANNIAIPIEKIALENANAALDRLAGASGKQEVKGRMVIDFTSSAG